MYGFADHLHPTLNNKQLASHKASHWTEESENVSVPFLSLWQRPERRNSWQDCVCSQFWRINSPLGQGRARFWHQEHAVKALQFSRQIRKQTGQEKPGKVPYSPKTAPSAGDQVLITGTFRASSHSNRSIESCVVLWFYTGRSCKRRAHPPHSHCQEKRKWQQQGARVSAAIPLADPILAHFHLSLKSSVVTLPVSPAWHLTWVWHFIFFMILTNLFLRFWQLKKEKVSQVTKL